MKHLFLLTLVTYVAWSKPIVMISYFDAFHRASFNNSETVAVALAQKLGSDSSPVSIALCPLNTIFDQAYAQTETCLKKLSPRPVMVVGLGESSCDLKVETMVKNNDQTVGPDNAGIQRSDTSIIAGAPLVLGLRYPLPQMYCALNRSERNNIELSNFAGSFVCNNTAYQMSYYYSDVLYGFIHVPANNCTNLTARTNSSILMLEKMITQGATYLSGELSEEDLPHTSNEVRLSVKKNEIKKLRRQYQENECLEEYFKRVKGDDEKRIFQIRPALMN